MLESMQQAIVGVLGNPAVPAIILMAAAYGVFMGAVPGLTATMAVALVVPVTFFLDPISALAAIVTLEACAIFAGDIPNTLLRIPGTPSSAAYADDAYALTRAGRSQQTLGVCLTFSVIGGLFGALVLLLLAPTLATIATWFSAVEYFWLYLLGLGCAVVVSRGSTLKAIVALIVGLLLSTVGLSAVHTVPRFTFGRPELVQGIRFIPAMIGLFGFSEVLRGMLQPDPGARPVGPSSSSGTAPGTAPDEGMWRRCILGPIRSVFGEAVRLLRRRKRHALRSGTIGSLVGMLPGAGADIGAWVSLAVSKRLRKDPAPGDSEKLEGIADATAANNSALAGAWVPAMVFGIPGDSVTAIVIGVLLMKNIKPGPEIFQSQGPLVYSIFLMFLLANLVLIPVGFLAIKTGGLVVRVPRRILLPLIVLFCVIGSYAIAGSYFDVGVMLALGVVGFLLERRRVPLGPVVLGIILGGPLEERFVQTLVGSGGSLTALFARPMAAALGALCMALWLTPAILAIRRRVRRTAETTPR